MLALKYDVYCRSKNPKDVLNLDIWTQQITEIQSCFFLLLTLSSKLYIEKPESVQFSSVQSLSRVRLFVTP